MTERVRQSTLDRGFVATRIVEDSVKTAVPTRGPHR